MANAENNNNRRREFPAAFQRGRYARGGNGDRRDGGNGDRREFPGGGQRRGYNDRRGGYNRSYYDEQDRLRAAEEKRAAEDKEKSKEFNEINFPSLASSFGGGGSATGHAWSKAGTELARAWSDADEEQRIREELRQQREERERRQLDTFVMRRPYGGGAGYSAQESSVYIDDDYDEPPPQRSEDADWQEVNHAKKRRAKTGPQTMTWKPVEMPPEEDTVWGGDQEEDSVW